MYILRVSIRSSRPLALKGFALCCGYAVQYFKPALQKTRDPGIRDPSSIDISRKIFEISRKIFEIWQYNITNKKTAYYFFEPLVQPFEHFKHCNTDIITLYTHAY